MKTITIKNLEIQVDAFGENHSAQVMDLIKSLNNGLIKYEGSPLVFVKWQDPNVPEFEISESEYEDQ